MKKRNIMWVDYKDLKSKVPIIDVLKHFNIELNQAEKAQHAITCPLPNHGGDRSSKAFSINTQKHCFQCLSSCGGGNALDLFCLFLGKDPKNKSDLRAAGVEMQSVFLSNSPKKTITPIKLDIRVKPLEPNKPLNFTLTSKKDVPFLLDQKKIPLELLQELDIGWASKSMMAGRIIVPIHNTQGELVAYAGRGLKELDIQTRGRWLLPSGFHKSLELWNYHRIDPELVKKRGLVVCEGMWSAIRWMQAGFPSVALMGCEMSSTQEELIIKASKRVWLMLDNDKAGRAATDRILPRLAQSVFVRLVNYPPSEGEGDEDDSRSQPEDFTPEDLVDLLR